MSLKRDFAEAFQTPSPLLRAATERAIADLGADAPAFLSSLPLHIGFAGHIIHGSAFIWRMARESAELPVTANVFLPLAQKEGIRFCLAFAHGSRWRLHVCIQRSADHVHDSFSDSLEDFTRTIEEIVAGIAEHGGDGNVSILLSGPSFPHESGMIVANYVNNRECFWLRNFSPHILVIDETRRLEDDGKIMDVVMFSPLINSTRYDIQRVASLVVLSESRLMGVNEQTFRAQCESNVLSQRRYASGSLFELDYLTTVVAPNVVETLVRQPWEPFGGMTQAFAFFALVGHRRSFPRLGIETRYPDAPRFVPGDRDRPAAGMDDDLPLRETAASFFRLHYTAFSYTMKNVEVWTGTIGRLAVQFGRWLLFYEACRLLPSSTSERAFLSWLLPSCVTTLVQWPSFRAADLRTFTTQLETHGMWLQDHRLPKTKATWMRHVGDAAETLFFSVLHDFRATFRQNVMRFAEAMVRLPEAQASRRVVPRPFTVDLFNRGFRMSTAHPFICPQQVSELRPLPSFSMMPQSETFARKVGVVAHVRPDDIMFSASPETMNFSTRYPIAAFAPPDERERLFEVIGQPATKRFLVISAAQMNFLAQHRAHIVSQNPKPRFVVYDGVGPQEAVARVFLVLNSRDTAIVHPFYLAVPLFGGEHFALHLADARQELDLEGMSRIIFYFLGTYVDTVVNEIGSRFDVMRQQFIAGYDDIKGSALSPMLFRLFSHGNITGEVDVLRDTFAVLQHARSVVLTPASKVRLIIEELTQRTAPLFHRLVFAGKRPDLPPAPLDYVNFEQTGERGDFEICNVYTRDTVPAKNFRINFMTTE